MPAHDPTRWFLRAQRGLFAGKQRLSGNHVSPSKRQCVVARDSGGGGGGGGGGPNPPRGPPPPPPRGPPAGPRGAPRARSTPLRPTAPRALALPVCSVRRHWLPNVQSKRLWSGVLARQVQVNVTAAALRWMRRAGGLDAYLLNTPAHKLASRTGVALQAAMRARIADGTAGVPNSPQPPRGAAHRAPGAVGGGARVAPTGRDVRAFDVAAYNAARWAAAAAVAAPAGGSKAAQLR
jgi:ribosomal protein L28